MPSELPRQVALFFQAANSGDVSQLAHVFDHDAIVLDESSEHHGASQIAAWLQEAQGKYKFRAEPLAWKRDAGTLIVQTRVSGEFKGSPTDLAYAFTLGAGRIKVLEIS